MLYIIIVLQLLTLILLVLKLKGTQGKEILRSKKKVILDTCALIDGRILSIVQAGFAPDELVVPAFVMRELQILADGRDALRRERARFGLDVIATLQKDSQTKLSISNNDFKEIEQVDDKLIALAKKLGADLCTTDFNLNKVATISGVRVLNVNELSQSIRTIALPGEELRIKLQQKGSSKNQAIGYLEDGTMVVVDGAASRIGQETSVRIERVHQTAAGKMLFASILNKK